MYPNLIEIGGLTITTFGVMMVLSFVTGGWILSLQLERRGFDPKIAWDILVWTAIAGIVGARVYYLALHIPDVIADPVRELTSRGGLVWYGGLFGGILAYYWQVRKYKLPVGHLFDASAPALMLAYAVGRLGCFLVGDDYGLPTDSWVGVKFPHGAPPSTAGNLRAVGGDIPVSIPDHAIVAVHPTQLYEIGAALILFAVLWKVSKRKLRPGQLFGLYLGLYGVERFLIEFVRAKGDRMLLGLSTSQLASILLLGVATYLWNRRGAESAAVPQGTSAARARVRK